RLEAVGGAVVGHSVAALRRVAYVGRRAADHRALRIRGAGGAPAGAVVGDVADAGGRAALDRVRLEAVRRAVVRHAVAALGEVTRSSCRPTDGTALQVDRSLRAGPGARLRQVADPRGRTARR